MVVRRINSFITISKYKTSFYQKSYNRNYSFWDCPPIILFGLYVALKFRIDTCILVFANEQLNRLIIWSFSLSLFQYLIGFYYCKSIAYYICYRQYINGLKKLVWLFEEHDFYKRTKRFTEERITLYTT